MRKWIPLGISAVLLVLIAVILVQRHASQAPSAAKPADGPRELVAGEHGIKQPRATPDEEQIETVALGAAADYAASHNSIALIVSRHGHIVFEQYWGGTSADTVVDAGAFASTVAAMMVGLALDDRHIARMDQPVSDFLASFQSAAKEKITLRELLQSQDAQAMVALVEKLSGRRYSKALSRMLWKPLSAGDAWVMLDRPGGDARADCCFFARPLDWLRLAQLLISDGEYQGSRVLPQGWVATMTAPSPGNAEAGSSVRLGIPRDGFYLAGRDKARLWLHPGLHLAILRMGGEPRDWDETRIPSLIVAGVRDRVPLPAKSEVDLSKLVPHH